MLGSPSVLKVVSGHKDRWGRVRDPGVRRRSWTLGAFWVIHACNYMEASCHHHVGEGCADDFACKWGGVCPDPPNLPNPQPPTSFEAVHAYNKQASCHHHDCGKGELCGSFFFQMGDLRPPNPLAVLKPSMFQQKRSLMPSPCLRSKGRLCGSFCLPLDGAACPPTPLFKAGLH